MVKESQKQASKNYLKKFEDIKIRVPIGKRDEYKKIAADHGKSLNSFIVDLLEEYKK